jgi:hypothetical protein
MKIARFVVADDLLDAMFKAIPPGWEIVYARRNGDLSTEYTIKHPDLPDVLLVGSEQPPLIQPTIKTKTDVETMELEYDWDWGIKKKMGRPKTKNKSKPKIVKKK